ncbi:MAG: DUF6252 family protein [Spirosomataceae bacterium]
MKHLLPPLLFTVWVLFVSGSCREKEKLPAPTTEGLNTFGCKINGKVWIANGMPTGAGSPWTKPIEIEFNRLSADTFYLFIHTTAQSKDRVQLTLSKAVVGVNLLNEREPFAVYYDDSFRHFFSRGANAGKVVITKLDTVNHIISGTFSFEGQEIVNKQTVSITEGRFDIDWDKL